MRLAGALLAAGGSTRLGRAKAFLELGGETFLARLARELAAVAEPVIVVVPPRSPAYGRTVEACGARAVVNPNPARGMGSSLAVAATALRPWAPDADALLVALVDQPLADRELFARLRDATAAGLGFAVSDYGDGALGPPAVFPRPAFPALRALTGDRGARALLERAGDRVARVPFPGGRFDIDTAADYARLLAESDSER